MNIIYSGDPPVFEAPSLFLAGPTPRRAEVLSWRPEAIQILGKGRFSGTVLIPERLVDPFGDRRD